MAKGLFGLQALRHTRLASAIGHVGACRASHCQHLAYRTHFTLLVRFFYCVCGLLDK